VQYLLSDEEELIVRDLFKEMFVREKQDEGEVLSILKQYWIQC
jgi:hypothetical protein